VRSGVDEAQIVVRTMAEVAVENERYFGDLDAVVGDGDFGFSLARGFEVVLARWDELDRSSIGALLKAVGMIITTKVGGTSGPLWGTGFLRAAAVAAQAPEVGPAQAVEMLRAAIEGIKQRGRSDLGDKTLLDALVPAVDAVEQQLGAGETVASALGFAAATARQKAEETRDMLAKRGRAAYVGERSIGTLDAGAVAVAVMFEAVATRWPTEALEVTEEKGPE
jgi:phosphoenolpyruvate---glycerone phosphotransferase subunit DhaL